MVGWAARGGRRKAGGLSGSVAAGPPLFEVGENRAVDQFDDQAALDSGRRWANFELTPTFVAGSVQTFA